MQAQVENRILRRRDVEALVGLNTSALYRLIGAGDFPKPIRLSPDPRTRAVGWTMRQIQTWIESRERDAEQAA